MGKYQYSATVKGETIQTNTVAEMTEKINTIFEFPVVTKDTLDNYFTRPHVMRLKTINLESLLLKRFVKSSV